MDTKYDIISDHNEMMHNNQNITTDDLTLAIENKSIESIKYMMEMTDIHLSIDRLETLKNSIKHGVDVFTTLYTYMPRMKAYDGLLLESIIRDKPNITIFILRNGIDNDRSIIQHAKMTNNVKMMKELHFYGFYDDETIVIINNSFNGSPSEYFDQ